MSVISGKFGLVDGGLTVRNWSIAPKAETRPYVASNTLGGTGRIQGIRDWTGSFDSYGGQPIQMPGDKFHFAGYTGPTDGVALDDGSTYDGDAMVESIEVSWDWKQGNPISNVVQFGANGKLLQQSASPSSILDTSTPDVPSPLSLHPTWEQWDTGGSVASSEDFENVVSATLKIMAANKTYCNSSTEGQTKRVMGPIDWTLSMVLEDQDPEGAGLYINSYYLLTLPVNGTDFWELKWGILDNIGDIRVDRESGEIIRCTLNFKMAGFIPLDIVVQSDSGTDTSTSTSSIGSEDVSSTSSDEDGTGEIVLPDGTNWWPFEA